MKKKFLILMGCLSLIASTIPVSAQTSNTMAEKVETAESQSLPELLIDKVGTGKKLENTCNSVMQVLVTYTAKTGEKIPVQGGSGFLIGDDQGALSYLVTTRKNVFVSDERIEEIVSQYALEKASEVTTKIEVVISKDVTVEATIVTASEEMDFAILQLGQTLHDRQALLFHDQGIEPYLRNTVSVIGYPTAAQYGEPAVYYTTEELQKTEGFLETEQVINGQKYVQHHIFPNYGNIGGPIVDEKNAVLALNQSMNDGKSFYALEIQQIMSVCDSLGIPYKTVSMQEAEEAAALAAIVHKEGLQGTIAAAEKINLKDYKKATTTTFAQSLESAKKINAQENATQEQVDEAQKTVQAELNQLVLKTPLSVVLSIAGVIVLACVIVIFILLKVTSEKRAKKKAQKKAELSITEPAPDFSQKKPIQETSYKELLQAGNQQVESQSMWSEGASEEFSQTVVLGSSVQEEAPTSVLSQKPVTLVRVKDHENIWVYKYPFMIGKDREKADYCVQDNAAVSRIHATIYAEGNTCFIEDNHATNGTFVNGIRVEAGTRVILKNNDRINLGNEEFDFKAVAI